MTNSFQAHDYAVSRYMYICDRTDYITKVFRISYHPTKPIIATCSDDHTWKLWNLPRYIKVLHFIMARKNFMKFVLVVNC